MALMTLASTAFVTAATLGVGIAAGYALLQVVMAGIERMLRTEAPAATVVPFVARPTNAETAPARQAA